MMTTLMMLLNEITLSLHIPVTYTSWVFEAKLLDISDDTTLSTLIERSGRYLSII